MFFVIFFEVEGPYRLSHVGSPQVTGPLQAHKSMLIHVDSDGSFDFK